MPTTAETFVASTHRLFIGGRWEDGRAGERIDVEDPSTGERIASVVAGGAEDIDRAVNAAQRALDDPHRTGWSPADRTRLIWALADAIDAHADELAEIETLDVGKPLRNSRNIDIPGAAAALRYFSGWATKIGGETMPVSIPGDWHAYTVREAVGVVGQIIPWNYPLMGAVTKMAPALAAGCSIVLKPAEQTPLSALRMGQLIESVGFPSGTVNIVTGHGRSAGAALVQHPGVAKISFTGSTATGKGIVRAASETIKRVTVELGGKSPVIVFPDADLEKAAVAIAQGIFLNSGQTCSAGSHLFVHRAVAEPLVAAICDIAREMRLGPGMDIQTQLGPLVSAQHLEKVLGFVEQGRRDGATIAIGGLRRGDRGYFVEPTVLTGTRPGMSVVDEEIFGPVLCVSIFDETDLDAIAEKANATVYGLAAYVWTRDVRIAHGLVRRLKAGSIRVNAGGGGDFAMPVGGYKQSGFGRENGRLGVEAYTELKSVMMAV